MAMRSILQKTAPWACWQAKQHRYISVQTHQRQFMSPTGMNKAQLRIIQEGIFEFCGLKTQTVIFADVKEGTDEMRKGYLTTIL